MDVLIGNVENATIEEMVLNKPISDHEIHDGGIQNKFLEGSKILGTQNRPIPWEFSDEQVIGQSKNSPVAAIVVPLKKDRVLANQTQAIVGLKDQPRNVSLTDLNKTKEPSCRNSVNDSTVGMIHQNIDVGGSQLNELDTISSRLSCTYLSKDQSLNLLLKVGTKAEQNFKGIK